MILQIDSSLSVSRVSQISDTVICGRSQLASWRLACMYISVTLWGINNTFLSFHLIAIGWSVPCPPSIIFTPNFRARAKFSSSRQRQKSNYSNFFVRASAREMSSRGNFQIGGNLALGSKPLYYYLSKFLSIAIFLPLETSRSNFLAIGIVPNSNDLIFQSFVSVHE